MIQKTLITNSSTKLIGFATDIAGSDELARSGDAILFFSDQNDDKDHLHKQIAIIRQCLPDVKVVGITMPGNGVMHEYDNMGPMAGFSMMMLDTAKADVYSYDCKKVSVEEAGKQFRKEVSYKDHVAGIFLYSAGLEREIDRFITTLAGGDRYDIPVIGVQAGASVKPYVCGNFNDDGVMEKGLTAVVFYGKDLHLHYNYDMGWKAIGKEMTVTGTDGNYCINTIDDAPAVSIYHDYLGVEPDEYFTENVREFPLITYRGDRQVVRTPSAYDRDDRLHFIAKVNEGDKVKLSYGNPRRLIEETSRYADAMQGFGPQALLMIICENRARFLGDQAASDVMTYRSFMPDLAWSRGFAAVMMDHEGGGVVNSAILTVGMREGAQIEDEIDRPVVISDIRKEGATPLDQRLAMFLERTTKELEDMAVAADAANAAKSEFLSQMSHEIRTPINAVLGMNEMILRDATDETILKYAQNARTASLSLLNIISDILDFSKIEAGKMDIVPYEYELTSMINDLVNLISHRAEEKGLALVISVDPDMPHMLFGDEIRLKQIITNLLTNAVKYTERGTVTLTVNYEKKGTDDVALHVAVSDTGVGIRKENIHKLFLAFDRIDKNRARKIEGTGLGLNITSQLLGLMGSELKVESVYGEGSTFSFVIRQKVTDWDVIGDFNESVKRISRKKSAKKKTQFTAEGARILVVDDAPMNLDVIVGLLRRTLITIDTAESGKECIDKVGTGDYDMIFLDHRMPEMDGLETFEKLKELYWDKIAQTPVISLTANAVAGAREQYIEAGFSYYLTKPVMPHELEEMIQRYLPDEKVLFTVADEAEEEPEAELPEWLDDIHLLDTEKGIMYCGGVAEYLDALSIFAASISQRAAELEDAINNNDINNFTIRIHALKTMTKSIGAVDLSELAASLEEAGKTGDKFAIESGVPVFLELYRSLESKLSLIDMPKPQVTTVGGDRDDMHHILVVDDDSDFIALVSRWLKKEYKVSAIGSGEQAITYLQTEKPELILLDYAMPGMSGLDVLEYIRSNPDTKSLPVIFLTGTEDREIVKSAEKLHPEGFLLKSMGKSGLMMAVNQFFLS